MTGNCMVHWFQSWERHFNLSSSEISDTSSLKTKTFRSSGRCLSSRVCVHTTPCSSPGACTLTCLDRTCLSIFLHVTSKVALPNARATSSLVSYFCQLSNSLFFNCVYKYYVNKIWYDFVTTKDISQIKITTAQKIDTHVA
jgi:hypothetical protein